ncbi:MAG: alpha/beta fold hydrolase, partial [Solirubrobacterales bacterium]
RAGHRAIALDHLGFGRSDKPDDADLYTIDRHIDRAEALLESLNLSEVTPVVQDWGGPIGLGWATRHPERIRSLMILNTFAHRPPDDVPLPIPLKLFRQPGIGEGLVKGLNLFTRAGIFLGGVVKRERLSEEVRSAYLAPHPDWSSRTGVLMFPREIPSGPEGRVSDLMAEVEQGLEAFADRDVKICWAMRDIAFTEEMLERMWLKTFPDAEVRKIDDAGHYLQEDAHEVIIPELLELVGR